MNRMETGFTIVELVVVLVVIGILSSVGFSRFASVDRFQARGFIDEAFTTLHYARRMATSSGCHIRVLTTPISGSTPSNLQIHRWGVCQPPTHDNSSVPIANPSNTGTLQIDAPNGINLSTHDFYFNGGGVPFNRVSNTAFSVVTNINITSNLGTNTIILEPETGFIHQ